MSPRFPTKSHVLLAIGIATPFKTRALIYSGDERSEDNRGGQLNFLPLTFRRYVVIFRTA